MSKYITPTKEQAQGRYPITVKVNNGKVYDLYTGKDNAVDDADYDAVKAALGNPQSEAQREQEMAAAMASNEVYVFEGVAPSPAATFGTWIYLEKSRSGKIDGSVVAEFQEAEKQHIPIFVYLESFPVYDDTGAGFANKRIGYATLLVTTQYDISGNHEATLYCAAKGKAYFLNASVSFENGVVYLQADGVFEWTNLALKSDVDAAKEEMLPMIAEFAVDGTLKSDKTSVEMIEALMAGKNVYAHNSGRTLVVYNIVETEGSEEVTFREINNGNVYYLTVDKNGDVTF